MPRLPLLSLTLFVALLAGACDRQSAGEAQQQENSGGAKADSGAGDLTGILDRSHAGEAIPDVALADPSGASLELSETGGKPVLLNLWATWCAPCVTEMPLLDGLAGELGDEVRVMTVSEDLKGAELVAPFFAEKKFANLPQWMDTENNLAIAFGGASLPLTVLYDAGGKEVWRVIGGFDWSSAEARGLVDEGLGDGR
jgi:thiol-disulfide isomerase/thioredoxin